MLKLLSGRSKLALVFAWIGAAGLVIAACRAGESHPIEAGAVVAATDACGRCHAEEFADWRRSREHRDPGAGSPCLQCHGPHATDPERGEGPAPLVAGCEDCHREVQAQFAMPFRHPLDAGSLGAASGCTSCHPPHGLAGLRARDHLRHDACLECHRELAGPFLFEHDGSRERLCLSCHEAHGSPNRRLLTHADSRSLCSSCHMNLEDIHIQNPGSTFRNCLLCHTEIHGSDWDRELRR